MASNPAQAWIFLSLIFTTAQVEFITSKIALIFKTSFHSFLELISWEKIDNSQSEWLRTEEEKKEKGEKMIFWFSLNKVINVIKVIEIVREDFCIHFSKQLLLASRNPSLKEDTSQEVLFVGLFLHLSPNGFEIPTLREDLSWND